MNTLGLSSIFGNNMILQRARPIPVWGWASPGEEVVVTLGGQRDAAYADQDGRWRVTLAAMQPAGPLELLVTGKDSTVRFTNVLMGDVWLCSGQSNMQRTVSSVTDAAAEIAAGDFPRLRHIEVPRVPSTRPRDDFQATWQVCSPETVGAFTAVGYYFGRDLLNHLDVPIGLIHSSWGGTPAEAWTDRQTLVAHPDLKPCVDRADAAVAPLPPIDAKKAASALYNGMIHPLVGVPIVGVIWYQGESNETRAQQYRTLLPAMIGNWRTLWGQGQFPFLIVQLVNYRAAATEPGESAWAELREAQLRTLNAAANTALVVAADLGNNAELSDAADLHPKNKRDVGKRLALAALKLAYGHDIEHTGPVYSHYTIEGDAIRLHFTHADGLTLRDGQPAGFAVAGADRKFVWADATIQGQTVLVRGPRVQSPGAARYAWDDNPPITLYNRAGLPASPFRTDDWPMLTAGKR